MCISTSIPAAAYIISDNSFREDVTFNKSSLRNYTTMSFYLRHIINRVKFKTDKKIKSLIA